MALCSTWTNFPRGFDFMSLMNTRRVCLLLLFFFNVFSIDRKICIYTCPPSYDTQILQAGNNLYWIISDASFSYINSTSLPGRWRPKSLPYLGILTFQLPSRVSLSLDVFTVLSHNIKKKNPCVCNYLHFINSFIHEKLREFFNDFMSLVFIWMFLKLSMNFSDMLENAGLPPFFFFFPRILYFG